VKWTDELEAFKQQALKEGYIYWNKGHSGGGIVYEDHCIYTPNAREIIGRSYSEAWAWVLAFRTLGWLE
jgi:hypothetical protein